MTAWSYTVVYLLYKVSQLLEIVWILIILVIQCCGLRCYHVLPHVVAVPSA